MIYVVRFFGTATIALIVALAVLYILRKLNVDAFMRGWITCMAYYITLDTIKNLTK